MTGRPVFSVRCSGRQPRLEQGRDPNSRVEVLYRRELLAQLRLERGAPRLPLLAQLLRRGRIEGGTVRGDLVADGGDAVLELERRAGVAVRLQELPEPFVDA